MLASTYPTFGGVIEKAMAKEPEDRYLSAGDFARDANAALRGARYTGAPTVVATGEARPSEAVELPPVEQTVDPTVVDQPVAPQAFEQPVEQPVASPPPAAAKPREPGSFVMLPAGVASQAQTAPPEPETVPPAPNCGARATDRGAHARTRDAGAPPRPRSRRRTPLRPRRSPRRQGHHQWLRSLGPPAGAPAGARDGSRLPRWRSPALWSLWSSRWARAARSSTPTTPPPGGHTAAALPVPTNRVTGNGSATVQLHGNVATVTLDTNGLLNGSPHGMHIHAGGKGLCPPASTARLHNGHRTISTTDGIKFCGPPQVSLTTSGDTSAASRVDFSRYPTDGNARYERADIVLTPGVADAIRAGDAVIVVHGIDYNGNHIYDDVLDRSELNPSLSGRGDGAGVVRAAGEAEGERRGAQLRHHVHGLAARVPRIGELPGRSHLAAVRAGQPRPAGDRAIAAGLADHRLASSKGATPVGDHRGLRLSRNAATRTVSARLVWSARPTGPPQPESRLQRWGKSIP